MNKEEQIRAKALELAILTFGKEKERIPFPPATDGGPNAVDTGLLMRAGLLAQYIRGESPC
jgi:hypothetical protein